MRLLLIQMVYMLWTSVGFGQGNCGVFDRRQCISALPEHAIEEAKLKARATHWDDSLKLLASRYQSYLMSGAPHGAILDSSDVMRMTDEMRSYERVILECQENAQWDLVELERVSTERLNGILVGHLWAYCEENGLSFVVERDALLYGPECADLTGAIIDFLRRR